jgi:hypothetical protein
VSLLVWVLLAPSDTSLKLKPLEVPAQGATITISVSAPGLVAVGDLERDLLVPANADSEPVRFGFTAGTVGLHRVVVRAFAGGTLAFLPAPQLRRAARTCGLT